MAQARARLAEVKDSPASLNMVPAEPPLLPGCSGDAGSSGGGSSALYTLCTAPMRRSLRPGRRTLDHVKPNLHLACASGTLWLAQRPAVGSSFP